MTEDSTFSMPKLNLSNAKSVSASIDAQSKWWNRFLDHQYSKYRQVLGPSIDHYLSSQQAATEGVQHEDPVFREAALFVLENAFGFNLEVCDLCERLLDTEEDEAVRIAAMSYVMRFRRGSRDKDCASRFAKIVALETEGLEARRFAYWCLLNVLGSVSDIPPELQTLRFPDDIDWRLVREAATP
jgi:hypothetical protein